MKQLSNLNLRWEENKLYDEKNNTFYGAICGIVGFLVILTIWMLNIFSLWHYEIGFIDPSSSFVESLIKLYNFVWCFLILILVVILIILGRIIYLFNWNSRIELSFVLNKIFFYIINFLLNFAAIVSDKNLMKNYTLRLNELEKGSNEFNIWYQEYNKYEFLLISDLNEYKRLEFIWCVIPTLILVLIAGPSFSLVFSLDSIVYPEININVVGRQWYWVYSFDNILYLDNEKKNINFRYDSNMVADDDLIKGTHRLLEVNNKLLLPVGVPVRFLITSMDVLHSWAVPALGLKVDAVPGRLNQFIVEIKKPGTFYGQCSELCGSMHGFMPIIIQAVDYNEYKQWIKSI